MPCDTAIADNLSDIFLQSSLQKAYNNIRDQVIVPNEASTADKHKHSIPQFSSGYSAPLQNGGRRDHNHMSGLSTTEYQTRDLIVPQSFSSRTGGVLEKRFPQATQILSPPSHTIPTKALRRTEVATYRCLSSIYSSLSLLLTFNDDDKMN